LGARLLVVDDNPLNARLLEAQLVSAGYEVVACHDGLAGLAELLRGKFDAVLLDVLMPPPDGFETCRLIRASEPDGERIPVIFVTALVGAPVREQAMACGGDALITKPATREEVVAQIEAMLAKSAADGARDDA
jgi:CheY-like chemotaxis protein